VKARVSESTYEEDDIAFSFKYGCVLGQLPGPGQLALERIVVAREFRRAAANIESDRGDRHDSGKRR
jgi:hypothetical protein